MPDSPSSPPTFPPPETSLVCPVLTDTTPQLPRRFSLALSGGEFNEVSSAAQRFSGGFPPAVFHVSFHDNERIWKFHQANVTLTRSELHFPETTLAGSLTLPVHFFESIELARVRGEADDVQLEIDLDANTITYSARRCRVSTTLPQQTDPPFLPEWNRTSRVIAHGPFVAQFAAFLASRPLGNDDDFLVDGIAPFIQATSDGDTLTFSRDWSRYGGPTLSMSVEAGGDFRGSFSMFAEVIAREILVATDLDSGLVSFEFNEAEPHLCLVKSGNLCLAVSLGYEHVFEYRHSLEVSLVAGNKGLVMQPDNRIGWNPTVVVTIGDRTVHATLTPGQNGRDGYIRFSTDIASDVPWSSILATELNAWNDRWSGITLIHADNVLQAVCDMPVSAMSVMSSVSDAVVDLHEKAQIVDDLIAAIL